MTATATAPAAQRKKPRDNWFIPIGLLVLSLVPVLAGSVRLGELATGAEVTAANARFFASPVPVVAHIIGATIFSVVGAFQFVPSLRRKRWHRLSGRIVAPAGLVAALSGLYMTLFYALPAGDGFALMVIRLVVGLGMVASLVLGFRAVRRRDFRAHAAWMSRAYAIGIAAGTQAVVLGGWLVILGPMDEATRAVLMGASWAINLAVAELATWRRGRG